MSFGLTFDKLLIIGIIAVFLLGPDRLPYYASQLARLDPRQYDPRRIIRDALLEEEKPAVTVRPARSAAYAERQAALAEHQAQLNSGVSAGEPAPFDNEAT